MFMYFKWISFENVIESLNGVLAQMLPFLFDTSIVLLLFFSTELRINQIIHLKSHKLPKVEKLKVSPCDFFFEIFFR